MVTSGPTRDQPEPIAPLSEGALQLEEKLTSHHNIPLWVWLTPVPLLFAALLNLPYGYYTFVRIVVTLSAGLVAWRLWNGKTFKLNMITALFSLVCVLFNPIIPIRLDRVEWAFIDAVTALCFLSSWFVIRKPCRNFIARNEPVLTSIDKNQPQIADALGNVKIATTSKGNKFRIKD